MMDVPEWLQEQVITLHDIDDDDLDVETVKRQLNCFGFVYVLKFFLP